MQRVVTALVMLPILVSIVHFGSIELFIGLVVTVVALSVDEGAKLFIHRGLAPFRVLAVVSAIVLSLSHAVGSRYGIEPSGVWLAIVVLIPVASMARRPAIQSMVETIMGTLLPLVLIAWPLMQLLEIRRASTSPIWIYLLFVCTILADTAAYYVGRRFGRRKLSPIISPNKSWEGAYGGMAAAVLGAVVTCWFWIPELAPWKAAVLGAVLGFSAILGDLMESVLKRYSGVKDSSSLLPGHGGLLDRIDSLLFAAPAMVAFLWLNGL